MSSPPLARVRVILPAALLGALFILALAIRTSLVTTARFTADEADQFGRALEFVRQGHLSPLGVLVSGAQAYTPGPFPILVMALPLAIHPTPEAANLFFALLGALAVLFLADAFRLAFGNWAAALTGLLLACSPWTVLSSDRAWVPNLILPLASLAIWAAVRLRLTGHRRYLPVLAVAAALIPQVHLSAPALWAALAVIAAPAIRRADRRTILLSLALAVATTLPYLLHELSSGGANTLALLGLGHEWSPAPLWQAPLQLLSFLTLDSTYFELGLYWRDGSAGEWLATAFVGSWVRPAGLLRLLPFLLSLALAAAALADQPPPSPASTHPNPLASRRPWLLALATGLAVALLLLATSRSRVYAHYLMLLLPLPFALVAHWFARVAAERPRLRPGLILLAAAIAIAGTDSSLTISRRFDAVNGLATQRQVIAAIARDCPNPGATVSLTSPHRIEPASYQLLARESAIGPLNFLAEPDAADCSYLLRPADWGCPDDRQPPLLSLEEPALRLCHQPSTVNQQPSSIVFH